MKYSEEQKLAIKKYYPDSNYDELFKIFPGYTKRKIKEIATHMGVKNNNPGHRNDLSGQIFGKLTVMEIDHITDDHRVYWECQCSCGNKCVCVGDLLKSGKKKSCGCLKKEMASKQNAVDHTGEKFGMLTAIERIPNYKNKGRTYYRCICDCGNEKYVASGSLVGGTTKTCGCLSRKRYNFKKAFNIASDDDAQIYIIYKHTVPNGKVYIGITRQDAEKRWQNGNGYSTQKKFWRAIQKYGWENITHTILEKNLTEKEACERENLYIKRYKSVDSRYGYNVSEGGGTGRSFVTPVMQYYNGEAVNFFESHQQAADLLKVSGSTIKNYISGKSKIKEYTFEELPPIHTYNIDDSLYEIRSEKHLVVGELMRKQCRQKTIDRNKKMFVVFVNMI